jgi:hypothetical protein
VIETRRDAGRWTDRVRRRPVGSTASYSCTLANEAARICTPAALERWNPLGDGNVFRTGLGGLASLDLAGGTQSTTGRLSTTLRRASGISEGDGLSSIATRLNLTQRIGSVLDVTGHVSYFGNQTDGSIVGEVTEGVPYTSVGPTPADSFSRWAEFKLGSSPIDGRLDHLTIGGDLALRPVSWLALRAGASRDRVDEGAARTIRYPPLSSLDSSRYISDGPSDLIIRGSGTTTYESMRATAEASLPLGVGSGRALLVIGGERERRDALREGSQGWESGGGLSVTATRRYTNDALLALARVHLADRVTIGGGLRREKDSGADRRWSEYPSADIALRVPAPLGGRARLRAAYGESAQRYSLTGNAIVEDPIPEIYYGNPTFYQRPLPERMKELEGGIDMDWGTHGALTVTAYRRRVANLAYPAALPFGGGQIRTLDLTSHGFEVDGRTTLLRRAGVRWDVRGIVATNSNRVASESELPGGVGSVLTSGYPVGVASRRAMRFTDTNGNSVLEFNEVGFLNEFERFGGSTPTLSLALHTELRFGRGLSLTGALDRRSGAWTQSSYLLMQCRPPELSCAEFQDPATSFADQSRAWRDSYSASVAPTYDASFTRLREVALHWRVDGTHARLARAQHMRIVVAGRDLLTWTEWPGPDPEISSLGRGSITRDDARAVPLPRRFMLGFELDY